MIIVQSYLSTIIKADFSIVEMRIMLQIIRRCRVLTYGRRYSDFLRLAVDTNSINMDFVLQIKEIMGRSHNYAYFYSRLAHMQDNSNITWYDKDKKIWRRSSWINNIEVSQSDGIIRFSSPRWLADYICDFTRYGYRYYRYESAMALSNANAARLYLMTASLSKPFTYTIDAIKDLLGVKGYRSFSDFIRRVLNPVMVELEKKNLNGFKVIVNRLGSKKYGRPVSMTFVPVKREANITDTQARLDIKKEIPEILITYFQTQLNFSFHEIAGNRNAIMQFCAIKDWQKKLIDIVDRARRKGKNHGYIINALKLEWIRSATDNIDNSNHHNEDNG